MVVDEQEVTTAGRAAEVVCERYPEWNQVSVDHLGGWWSVSAKHGYVEAEVKCTNSSSNPSFLLDLCLRSHRELRGNRHKIFTVGGKVSGEALASFLIALVADAVEELGGSR